MKHKLDVHKADKDTHSERNTKALSYGNEKRYVLDCIAENGCKTSRERLKSTEGF